MSEYKDPATLPPLPSSDDLAELETLAALLEGRLDGAERDRLAAKLQEDPELYALFLEEVKAREAERMAEEGDSEDTAPENALEGPGEPLPFSPPAAAPTSPTPSPLPPRQSFPWVAAAATVAISLLLAWTLITVIRSGERGQATADAVELQARDLERATPPSTGTAPGPATAGRLETLLPPLPTDIRAFADTSTVDGATRRSRRIGAALLLHRLAAERGADSSREALEADLDRLFPEVDVPAFLAETTPLEDTAPEERRPRETSGRLAAHLAGQVSEAQRAQVALGSWAAAGLVALREERWEYFEGEAYESGLRAAREAGIPTGEVFGALREVEPEGRSAAVEGDPRRFRSAYGDLLAP